MSTAAARLDPKGAGHALARVHEVWGLSGADNARLFGVSRQAVGKWLEQGVPVDRAEAIADLAAATDLLIRYVKRDRIPAVVRRQQRVCDVRTRDGVRAAGLPESYPLDRNGAVVARARCQPIGAAAKVAGLRGVRARSAQSRDGAGRELAWFPATARSVAQRETTLRVDAWFFG